MDGKSIIWISNFPECRGVPWSTSISGRVEVNFPISLSIARWLFWVVVGAVWCVGCGVRGCILGDRNCRWWTDYPIFAAWLRRRDSPQQMWTNVSLISVLFKVFPQRGLTTGSRSQIYTKQLSTPRGISATTNTNAHVTLRFHPKFVLFRSKPSIASYTELRFVLNPMYFL